jgi:hypothetical protein
VSAGGPAFTLTITGIGFQPGATVSFVGPAIAATVVSSTQLTVSISASLIANPGALTVSVNNPDGYSTSTIGFSITGTAAPILYSASNALAGGPAFTLSVNGNYFVQGDMRLPPRLTQTVKTQLTVR